MTNEQIILDARIFLMEQGILSATNKTIIIQGEDGTEKTSPLPEEIHTYQKWKSLGYQVIKGERAIAKFPIWKNISDVQKGSDISDDEEKKKRMFMKTAFFFKSSQVKPM